MFKKLKILIVIISSVLLISCEEEQVISTVPVPEITGLSKVKTFHNDIVTIYGRNFGKISGKSSLTFSSVQESKDTTKWISSDECIKWTETEIIFYVEDKLETSNLAVCVHGFTSNKMQLEISLTPDFDMIEIKSGNFKRGSELGFPDERPVRTITLSKSFYMSKYEINLELWESVMRNNPSIHKQKDLPVYNLEWIDAIRFCNKLSKINKLDSVYTIVDDSTIIFDTIAKGYRLPTEAEWEYACKSGTNKDFPPSDDAYSVAWFLENSGLMPHKQGTKQANTWNLFDMTGNVWEWCWDWYDEEYYAISDSINPKGPSTGTRRVARGGSYKSGKLYIRSSNRTTDEEDIESCGLRIVRNK
jgi:formylglycine-generating enzyme required for sulfatase activity